MNLNILNSIFGFIGSLFPVIFPKNEFKPKRAIAVIILAIAMMFAVDHFGVDVVDTGIEKAGQLIELSEEAK